MHTHPTKDDFCHFPRDVRVGTTGGDVHCLQRWLAKAGYSTPATTTTSTSTTGTFDDATSAAVKKWQKKNKWKASGVIDQNTRKAYGEVRFLSLIDYRTKNFKKRIQKYGFATTTNGRVVDDCVNGRNPKGLKCVDVCAEFGDEQFCQTKCAKDDDARAFACRSACQDAFTGACDRAFPPTNAENRQKFITCLSHMPAECKASCETYN
jgi:hypothetical protein